MLAGKGVYLKDTQKYWQKDFEKIADAAAKYYKKILACVWRNTVWMTVATFLIIFNNVFTYKI